MKTDLKDTKEKLESAQSELNAWKFTPDSQTGKKLMARVRTLIQVGSIIPIALESIMLFQENQELGKQLSSGTVAMLESKLQLQVTFILKNMLQIPILR